MSVERMLVVVLLSAACTFGLRALPFIAFRKTEGMPLWLERLGQLLPSGIMAVLIIYCLQDAVTDVSHLLLPKLAAVLLVILTYRWKHNTLLSIVSGTALYMILLRLW